MYVELGIVRTLRIPSIVDRCFSDVVDKSNYIDTDNSRTLTYCISYRLCASWHERYNVESANHMSAFHWLYINRMSSRQHETAVPRTPRSVSSV